MAGSISCSVTYDFRDLSKLPTTDAELTTFVKDVMAPDILRQIKEARKVQDGTVNRDLPSPELETRAVEGSCTVKWT